MTKYICTKSFDVPTLFNGAMSVEEGDQIEILWSCLDCIQFMDISKGVTMFSDNAKEILENNLKLGDENTED